MPDHIILKLSRYLENSTNYMIPTYGNIFSSVDKKISMFEPNVAYACQFQQVCYMVSVAASTLGRSHLVSIDPDFIPPTHPTNVAWDSLHVHHGLVYVYGRLALPSRSTLYDQQDSNLDCPETIMWEELSLVCLILAFRWFLWFCELAHCPAEK